MEGRQSEKPGGYFPALDGLRTICFVWVVFGHGFVYHGLASFSGRLAGMGVHVFFALSGFLITTLLLRELSRKGRVDLPAFYVRRALRIFPVYYSALFVALAGILLLGDRFLRPLGVSMTQLNVPLVAVTHGVFVANWITMPLPTVLEVLWSVSVEEQFYLLFPITFASSSRTHPALRPIIAGLGIALAVRLYICLHGDVREIYRNTFATGDHLLLGALAAQLVHSNRERTLSWVRRLGTAGEVACFAVIALLCMWNRQRPADWYIEASISAIASASIVLLVAVGGGTISRILTASWMRKLGQLTYAAYVFHMYALAVAWALCAKLGLGIELAAPLRTLLGTLGAFVIAYGVRVAFERRVLDWKQRFERA